MRERNLTCPFCGKSDLYEGWGDRRGFLVGHNPPDRENETVRSGNSKFGGNCPGSNLTLSEAGKPVDVVLRRLDKLISMLEQE